MRHSSTSSRRIQYTRLGNGPDGCIRVLMRPRYPGESAKPGIIDRDMPSAPEPARVIAWFDRVARDLPWRRAGVTGWEVLVSEVMLQQTPVARVLPVYEKWIRVWPTPASLANDKPAEAIRLWGRLGYPRRALRLHEAARVIAAEHSGEVPHSYEGLRALPGVGEYTAAAVLAFAYRQRTFVLDTNVRRVLARSMNGQAAPPTSTTVGERRIADGWLPADGAEAARASVALMELGALVCAVVAPACERCPIASECAWRAAGWPAYDGPRRKTQTYAGSDRQCRGAILAVLRATDHAVEASQIHATWAERTQRERALTSLVDDGLVVRLDDGRLSLPR
jgi:A/G-specific adenine glycosylase